MNRNWRVTPAKIKAAVHHVVRVARPRRIVIFGSAARRGARVPNDVDLLVISRQETISRRKESVRIRHALRHITMPMDILVISEQRLQELADRPGLVYHEALKGRVVYEASK